MEFLRPTTNIQQRLIVAQEGCEIFKELGKDSYSDGDSAFDKNRILHLRLIIKESIDLPDEVINIEFSHIHDRILDQRMFS